jgi:hypothetical protein
MAKKKNRKDETSLVAIQPTEVEVLPPENGVVGEFLHSVRNTFKARAMRMNGLMKRIDESGQRTEGILRAAAERMEAAEASLSNNMLKEGLLPEVFTDGDEEE